MPFRIFRSNQIDEENAFRQSTGRDGFIPVICRVRRQRACIHADANALTDDHYLIRHTLLEHQELMIEAAEAAHHQCGNPKIKHFAKGYYILVDDLPAAAAGEMAMVLAHHLDNLIIKMRDTA